MPNPNDYTVGWICAISTEFVAARAFLDKEHDQVEYVSPSDNNVYTLGEVGKHNVVIATLPDGEYGIAAAASVAGDMLSSFPNIRFGLLVGIGGGAPNQMHDIRLGDIVVSIPRSGSGGVLQYDFGKSIQDQEFHMTGFLDQPPRLLRAAVAGLRAVYEEQGHQLDDAINKVLGRRPKLQKHYKRPDQNSDRLYQSELVHPLDDKLGCATTCGDDQSTLFLRPQRTEDKDSPTIHYGLIASGNQLMKNALLRDKLAAEKNVLCFEMEAAGLMNRFPCLVIRGICDYSDSHKNKKWQGYAAMTAAAYAKDLLLQIPPNRVQVERRISDILSDMAAIQKDTSERVRRVQQNIDLAKLQPVEAAVYDSHDNEHDPRCHPDTRVDLLRQINEWVDDPCGKCTYWLQGMAGTGKSTIARTIAYDLDKRDALGASFFFKRGEGDRGKAARFFPTVAAQLVHKCPGLTEYVRNVIETNQSIAEKAIHEQFKKLILHPLNEAQIDSKMTMVVVVDALDECDREEDVSIIIHLLAKCPASAGLRFFVTSRPELHIRLDFEKVTGTYQNLLLHQVEERTTEADISKFLEDELSKTRDNYNLLSPKDGQLSSGWPGRKTIQELARIAVPLFIFAATTCRFISDCNLGPPSTQLAKILEYQTTEMSKLDATYGPVLEQLFYGVTEPAKKSVIMDFRGIVGSIVILARPLSTTDLSRLLEIDRARIDNRLRQLHSVLDIPSDVNAPVKLLHLSFRDFLLYEAHKSHPFWINERESHRLLATKCLDRLMNNTLKRDICGLETPGRLLEDVDSEVINRCLPSDVQYACLYWVRHLKSSSTRLHDEHQAFRFLRDYFLSWLEALSLIGRLSEAIGLVDELQSLVNVNDGTNISLFLHDAKRFILNCSAIIGRAPLQLYSSAIVFAPERSIVRETFNKSVSWIKTKPIVERDWNACMQTLEGHSHWVHVVSFSHDSQLVASASGDKTIRIWRADTGECTQTLEGHSGSVNSVSFSHDSQLISSASHDKTIRIWRADTGKSTQTLNGHSKPVSSVAFSHNSQLVASASVDETIRIWHTDIGECTKTLYGHSKPVMSVSFSHNSQLIASASDDKTVRIWRADTGECTRTLKGHIDWVTSVAFSHDSQLIASASNDKTIRIWRADTGESTQTLEGHSGPVMSVSFSHNSQLVASASYDKTIRIWRAGTGVCTQTLEGHRIAVMSVSFSHDSQLVASASHDKTIRIWRADMGKCTPRMEGHGDWVTSVAFSHDLTLAASASGDTTIRIWRADTGMCIQTFEGHSGLVWSVAFSHDSQLVASASEDKTIRIWRAGTGECTQTLEGHSDSVMSVSFSHNSQLVASASHDKTIRIWRADTGECTQTLEVDSDSVLSVVFSHDSTLAASTSEDTTIVRIWRADTGECTRTLKGHSDWVSSVTFSHDSQLIASASNDKTIRIWRTNTGECAQAISTGLSASILSFEPHSNRILTNHGAYYVLRMPSVSSAADLPEPPAGVFAHPTGYGISLDQRWITFNGKNTLWLPIEFDYTCSTVSESSIVIGCNSGRVIVLGFSHREN